MKQIIGKLKEKLKEKTGSTYLEMTIGILIFAMIIAFIVQFVPVLILKNQLNTFATNVSRILSVEGCYNDTVKEKVEEYQTASEIGEVTLTLTGTKFISGTDKIQLNDIIVVTVTTEYDLGFFTFGRFPIPLTNKAIARSEVYWK